MPRRRHWATNDDGSAALEFITVGVLLLVPLVYLVIALGSIQEQVLGAEAAARHTARAIGQATDYAAASSRSETVLAGVVDEYGMNPETVRVDVSCRPAVVRCPAAGATVIVTVSTNVSLPLVPPLFGLERAAAIPVEASAAQKMSRLWSEE